MNLRETMERYENQEGINRNEGSTGVKNLCLLLNAMGYKDTMHFGQFHHNGSYGDLINFLEDNSGCIEAIKEWIAEQDIQEWQESLESGLPEVIRDNFINGECPDCGEEIPDNAKSGEECSNCGHVWVGCFCDDCGKEKKTFMKPNGHNLEEVYGCPECDS